MENNLKNDETIIEVAKTKGKLDAVKICKLLYGINLKDAKDHVDEITKGIELPKPKISKFGCIVTLIVVLFILFLMGVFNNKKPDQSIASQSKNATKINIDSIIELIKKDPLFEIKDVYYNKSDSTLNIAFTNKDNVITEKNYSTLYFNKTYHIDSLSCFDGVYLFAFKKGRSLKKGDYKEYLLCESKRAGKLIEAFKDNFCVQDIECTALSSAIKKQLNDPDSYESQKIKVEWEEGNKFKVTNEFRAKNAFGAKVLNLCTAIVDIDGNVYDLKINK
jgi:ribosomal protein L7/L12